MEILYRSKLILRPVAFLVHKYCLLEVKGLLVGGPSGQLDFVLRAFQALTPCDPRNDVVI